MKYHKINFSLKNMKKLSNLASYWGVSRQRAIARIFNAACDLLIDEGNTALFRPEVLRDIPMKPINQELRDTLYYNIDYSEPPNHRPSQSEPPSQPHHNVQSLEPIPEQLPNLGPNLIDVSATDNPTPLDED